MNETETEILTEIVDTAETPGIQEDSESMEVEEYALSIRQPWPWLILRADVKDPAARQRLIKNDLIKTVENRTWRTNQRGRIWLHAAKVWDCDNDPARCRSLIMREYCLETPVELPVGCIVGRANLVDCVTEHPSRFFCGPYGFVLDDIQPLDKPVPCAGKQQFFKLDDAVVAKLPVEEVSGE